MKNQYKRNWIRSCVEIHNFLMKLVEVLLKCFKSSSEIIIQEEDEGVELIGWQLF